MSGPSKFVSLVAICCGAVPPLSAQRDAFGSPCDLRSGLNPVLLVTEPRTGVDLSAQVLTAPPTRPGFLLLGTSNARWAGGPLPFDLTGLGMPGCELLVEPLIAEPMPLGSLTLPTAALPGGTVFHLQAMTLDGAALAGATRGITVSLPDPTRAFEIAFLPDTQKYTEIVGYFPHFLAQVDDAIARDAAFVIQVGDIVQHGANTPAQWGRAREAMGRVDAVGIPWTVALGNHDYDVVGDKSAATVFVGAFGPSRYAGYSWYGGATPDGRSHCQLFAVEGERWLHLSLEWRPDDDDLAWAMEVLAAHADVPTIVSTHEHLGTGDPAPWRTGGSTDTSSGNNAGEDVYRKLCEPFPQVFLVLCGHVSGTGRRTDTTALGQVVHQMLADYQSDVEGGNGYYRRMRFEPRGQRVVVDTDSPSYVPGNGPDYRTDPVHNYAFAYDALGHRAQLRAQRVLRFRDGFDVGGARYAGTRDTWVSATNPQQVYGGDDSVWCDQNDNQGQGLLRFDGLVGTGAGQIPPGATVRRAILTLTFEGSNAQSGDGSRLHRMLVPWAETSSWTSLGNGVQLGLEASTAVEVDTRGSVDAPNTRSFDVTAAVQAWALGVANHGFVVLPNGTDGQSFRSSEWAGLVERPMLTVIL